MLNETHVNNLLSSIMCTNTNTNDNVILTLMIVKLMLTIIATVK